MQPGHVVEQKVAEQRQLRGDRGSGSEAGGACAGGQLAAQREQRRHALEPAASLPRIGEGPHHGPQPCGSGGRAAERDDQAVDHEERVLGEARQLVSRLGLRQETLQGEQQPARDHVEELEQVLQLPGEERLELEARVALLQADVRRAVKVHRREPVEEEARAEPRGHAGEGEPRCTPLTAGLSSSSLSPTLSGRPRSAACSDELLVCLLDSYAPVIAFATSGRGVNRVSHEAIFLQQHVCSCRCGGLVALL